MATGVEPRDTDFEFTRDDLDRLTDAFKNKEFRKMLSDYCEEMTDPSRQALYQKEMTQLEKERGIDVVFLNPEPGYVIKTSVAGMKKAFINICTNSNIGKPTYFVRDNEKGRGLEWKIPYSLASPHEDLDKKRYRCVVYDVVFHPNTLKFADKFNKFKKLVNKTACDALESNFSIVLDKNNVRFPKMKYKGHPIPTVIRTPDPNFKPDENRESDPSLVDELYPQKCYPLPPEPRKKPTHNSKKACLPMEDNKSPYTTPKYVIKQQRDIDIQEFTFSKTAKQYCAIPKSIIVHVNLPLVSSTVDCQLDVKGKKFSLICEKPAKYKLDINLPYCVDDECGSAKFDKSSRLLIVTLPVVTNKFLLVDHQKQDSGVESDNNSFSDEENHKTALITVIDTPVSESTLTDHKAAIHIVPESTAFLDRNLLYSLPSYTINCLDDVIAFTFHIRNVDPDSVVTNSLLENRAVQLKFTSVGSGFVPVYFAAYVEFPVGYSHDDVSAEAWDNNLILQVKLSHGKVPDNCCIGLDNKSTKTEVLEINVSNDDSKDINKKESPKEEVRRSLPVVEVVISKSDEVSISVISNCIQESNESRDIPNRSAYDYNVSVSGSSGSFKGILRHPSRMARSLSESSVDCRDFSSSIDCVSSDCIPEESSLKKTVRFNDVIAKQVFRSNSSILGQKKKNQRKSRNKKKSLERRLSESEADEPMHNIFGASNVTKVIKNDEHTSDKHRLDSGLSEISDGEVAATPGGEDHSVSKSSVKHSDKFYNPDKLNKGKYQEVAFKNDLIFDLDI